MKAIVFAGPTIRPGQIGGSTNLVWRPPAAQGDIYLAAREAPTAIGLIDGTFEAMPAVWHKEILWALSNGVHVFGAASMGALRAAELWPFGMVGVGKIFQAYKENVIEDDDEVALIHGPAELDFMPVSEAMVNIRATFARAESDAIVSPRTGELLSQVAKATFYKDRNWPDILALAERRGATGAELRTLRGWLPTGFVDQKREDALAMLDKIDLLCRSGAPRFQCSFEFQNSSDWQQVVRDFAEMR